VIDWETRAVVYANPTSQILFPTLAEMSDQGVALWSRLLMLDERQRLPPRPPADVWEVRPVVKEHSIELPDGGTMQIMVHTAGIEYDQRPALLVSVNDITETKRALHAEAEQRQFTEALLDIAAAINSTPRLAEVLDRILTSLGKVVEHDSANIMLIEEGTTHVVAHWGYPPDDLPLVTGSHFSILETFGFNYMVQTRTPIIVSDIRTHPNWHLERMPSSIASYIGAPIVLGDTVIGFVNLDSRHINAFAIRDANRLQVFTNQIAIAIQNAQTFEHARDDATREERQRLARDLHDAVSQTLFSAKVTAETLAVPHLIDSDPAFVRQGLTQLAKLTKGALSEMRTLLVELRPDALEEIELTKLLEQLVNALQTRTIADVSYTVSGFPIAIPTDAKITLYRIAQEALNNIIKHANADHISLCLDYAEDHILLRITDDGIGFDPDVVSADHMGVRIMRERAISADLALTIHSALKEGTIVECQWEALPHGSAAIAA
jgi:two-component system nitrate/nitrite sensor histidine kinase NarX